MGVRQASEKFYGLQILRWIAASLVVATHLWASAQRRLNFVGSANVLDNGIMGVDIFFGISGFVIYLSAVPLLASGRTGFRAAKEFFRRRFFRVAPSYYLLTLVKLLIFVVAPASMTFFRPHVLNTVASFFFVMRRHGDDLGPPVLAVGWTLCYEMLFYVIIALLLWLRVKVVPGCAVLVGMLSVVGWYLPPQQGVLPFLCNPIQLEFLAGMAIAASLPMVRRMPAWISAGLLMAGATYGLVAPHTTPVRSLTELHLKHYGVSGLLVVLAVVALERHVPFHRFRLLLLLGDASYALYLTHEFVLPLMVHAVFRQPLMGWVVFTVIFVGLMSVCYAVAVLYHLRLEEPLTRMFLRRLPWSLRAAEKA